MKILAWVVVVLLALVGVAYLYAASTEEFRVWMADRSMRMQDYPSAIVWYTRALRIAGGDENSPSRRQLKEKLYLAYEGFCRWEFNDNKLWGWFALRPDTELTPKDGVLYVDIRGNEDELEIQRLTLAPSRPYRFQLQMRSRHALCAALAWAPMTSIYTPRNEVAIDVRSSWQWEEYQVDIPPSPDGVGKFRLSLMNAVSGIEIDWIRIVPVR